MLWNSPYWVLPFVAAVLSAMVAGFAWRRRTVPGAMSLALLTCGTAWWALTNAITMLTPELEGKLFWFRPQYAAVTTVPPLFLVFGLAYTGLEKLLKPLRVAALFIWPLTVFLLALTNDHHHLIWAKVVLDNSGPIPMAIITHGPLFWYWVAYGNFCLAGGTILLIRAWFVLPGYYHTQLAVMLAGATVPWMANIIYLSKIIPFPGLDITPLSFTVTGVSLVWSLFRYRLTDLVPVARSRAFDSIGDAILIVDNGHRVVDINATGRRMLDRQEHEIIGRPLASFLSHRPELVEQFQGRTNIHDEIILRPFGQERHYDLRINPVRGRLERSMGSLIVLREVTEKRQAENKLKRSEEMFRSLVEFLPFPVVIFTGDRRAEFVNDRFVELFGYRRGLLADRPTYLERLIVDEDRRDAVRVQLTAWESSEFPERAQETVYTDCDGLEHEVIVHWVRLGDRVYDMIEDVTRRREAERARDLKARLQGVTEMAGAALHEMNQPLQAIYSHCELLMVGLKPEQDTYRRAEAIMKAVERLASINSKIMSITRYETREYDGMSRIIDLDKASKKDRPEEG